MEIRGQLRALQYFRKLITGETQNILPYTPVPQKPFLVQKSGTKIERCAPHKVGINSGDITNYLKKLNNRKNANVHTVQIVKEGKMICDASFAPYSTSNWHVSNSLCKTITGIAIGMLIDDGRLKYDDLVCDIFPEKCNFRTMRRTKLITIKHLLTMMSGSNFREAATVVEKDWVGSFLTYDSHYEPGTKFEYNSLNSYILSAIVRKITGQNVHEFLKESLYEPLGFGSIEWEKCPLGITKGGWGMYILPEDLAKIGLLFLQKGKYMVDGELRQIISEDYIKRATTQYGSFSQGQGYGFQIWVQDDGEFFAMNGMFGQNVFVHPRLSMVIVTNAGGPNLSLAGQVYNITKAFFESTKDNNASKSALNVLAQNYIQASTLKKLKYNTVLDANIKKTPIFLSAEQKQIFNFNSQIRENCQKINGNTYKFTNFRFGLLPIIMCALNDFYSFGLKGISFIYNKNTDMFYLMWTEGNSALRIPVGFEEPINCNLNFGGNVFSCAVCGCFTTDEDDKMVLKISIYFTECQSIQNLKFYFEENSIKVSMNETPDFIDIIENMRKNYPSAINKDLINFYQNENAQKIINRLSNLSQIGIKVDAI